MPMYIEHIPNRNSNPTWLLRESRWGNGKSVRTTYGNLTKMPEKKRREFLRVCLRVGRRWKSLAQCIQRGL